MGNSLAAKVSIEYVKPNSSKYLEIYKVLKSKHRLIYGESIAYLNGLYQWQSDINILVTECGAVDSRYLPDQNSIVICYESLYQKIYDYPERASSKKAFVRRVYQNVMFTFWHEMAHALMDQYGLGSNEDRKSLELLADELAVLSMLWRNEGQWKDIVMISALHFKSKLTVTQDKKYQIHASDQWRYEKMIVLLYGFAQKSYLRLKPEVDSLDWLTISPQEYYLERSAFWEGILRNHVQRDFF
ncbi:DUF4344 domain-containing metallopeptidase [Reichenbachiella sp.]|uniref:DUF4344 domain-containing metallopeptidase n=1 Tax=Reichenbachiella sp. TaxID=2184521 RepID=UPI003B5B7CCE